MITVNFICKCPKRRFFCDLTACNLTGVWILKNDVWPLDVRKTAKYGILEV